MPEVFFSPLRDSASPLSSVARNEKKPLAPRVPNKPLSVPDGAFCVPSSRGPAVQKGRVALETNAYKGSGNEIDPQVFFSVTRIMKLVVFAVIASAFISLGKSYLIDGLFTDMIQFG